MSSPSLSRGKKNSEQETIDPCPVEQDLLISTVSSIENSPSSEYDEGEIITEYDEREIITLATEENLLNINSEDPDDTIIFPIEDEVKSTRENFLFSRSIKLKNAARRVFFPQKRPAAAGRNITKSNISNRIISLPEEGTRTGPAFNRNCDNISNIFTSDDDDDDDDDDSNSSSFFSRVGKSTSGEQSSTGFSRLSDSHLFRIFFGCNSIGVNRFNNINNICNSRISPAPNIGASSTISSLKNDSLLEEGRGKKSKRKGVSSSMSGSYEEDDISNIINNAANISSKNNIKSIDDILDELNTSSETCSTSNQRQKRKKASEERPRKLEDKENEILYAWIRESPIYIKILLLVSTVLFMISIMLMGSAAFFTLLKKEYTSINANYGNRDALSWNDSTNGGSGYSWDSNNNNSGFNDKIETISSNNNNITAIFNNGTTIISDITTDNVFDNNKQDGNNDNYSLTPQYPTPSPTSLQYPSTTPSAVLSGSPSTTVPSVALSDVPSTIIPSVAPSTIAPSAVVSDTPSTHAPSATVSGVPSTTAPSSAAPSKTPPPTAGSAEPSTISPSAAPSTTPSLSPVSAEPSTTAPSTTPSTTALSIVISTAPSTTAPSGIPTVTQTTMPSVVSTNAPSIRPTTTPSIRPTTTPSIKPTAAPSIRPTTALTTVPTSAPVIDTYTVPGLSTPTTQTRTAQPFPIISTTAPSYKLFILFKSPTLSPSIPPTIIQPSPTQDARIPPIQWMFRSSSPTMQ